VNRHITNLVRNGRIHSIDEPREYRST
jgi:hypothetical protein